MSTLAAFARRCATGLVAAQIAFGTVPLTTPAEAATAAQQEGEWQRFAITIEGRPVSGVVATMAGGGKAAFALNKDGTVDLVIMDPRWRLDANVSVPVSLTIDGMTETGIGISIGNDVIEMKNVSRTVLSKFIEGVQAQLDVDHGRIIWTITCTLPPAPPLVTL